MAMLEDNAFLEYAQVFDNYYGTSKYWVEETIKQGKDVILEIDWQGARQVRQLLPETQGIFILPPSRAALEKRLEGRGQDDTKVIAQRMQAAISEMCHYVDAQWLIVNDNFEQALAELMAILQVQRLRCERQRVKYAGLLNDLLF
jgi:guanylate kinase